MRGGLARSFSLAGDSGSLHYDKVAATAFSPKLSLVYRPTPQTTLRSSLGKAFRAPTLFEFFGTAQLGGTDYVGNPGLRPESLRSWELGIDHSFSNGIDALLTLYRSQLDERIATQTTDNISRPANLAAARIEGVELELKGALPYGLHWSLNYTLTDSAVTRDPQPEVVGKQLPQAPEQLYNIGLGWRHAVWDLQLHHSYQSKRFTNVANSDTVTGVPGSTDAFHLTDFKASYRINEQLQAGLGINNLFDAQYHQFYRSPGRFWFAELRYDY
jgi:iron complex outermembrane receptor protein